MRIGELLLGNGSVSWETLMLALQDQERTGLRLCSLLCTHGLSFDDAARALGEQLGFPAVLRKHLEQRDRSLASLLPVEHMRRLNALPIGRLGDGRVLVCTRDPSEWLEGELSRLIGEPVLVAVAPAAFLERLVAKTAAELEAAELDAAPVLEVDEDAGASGDFQLDIDVEEPPAPDLDFDIDFDVASAPARPSSKPLPVVIKPVAAAKAPARDSLDATIASFADIDEVNWLLDVTMGFVAKKWSSALLLVMKEQRAAGVRGHGPKLRPVAVKTFSVPLDEPSIVQAAREGKRIADESSDEWSTHDASLVEVLGATKPVAAPILKGDEVAYVLVVGEVTDGDPEDAVVDLGLLIEAMGEALARM